MNHGLLVGAGFLLGTLGVKALKSEPVHKAAVAGLAQGMRLKEEAETLVDEAKAEFDDMMAEAGYEKEQEAEAKELPEGTEKPASKPAAKTAARRKPAAKKESK